MYCKVFLVLLIGIIALSIVNSKAIPGRNGSKRLRCPSPNEENASTPVTLHGNPDDCSKFFYCAHGRLVSFDCPDGLHFNNELKVIV